MSDVVEQVIQRHPEVKNEGIPEGATMSPHRLALLEANVVSHHRFRHEWPQVLAH